MGMANAIGRSWDFPFFLSEALFWCGPLVLGALQYVATFRHHYGAAGWSSTLLGCLATIMFLSVITWIGGWLSMGKHNLPLHYVGIQVMAGTFLGWTAWLDWRWSWRLYNARIMPRIDYRLSLRELFALTTVLAIAMGLIAFLIRG